MSAQINLNAWLADAMRANPYKSREFITTALEATLRAAGHADVTRRQIEDSFEVVRFQVGSAYKGASMPLQKTAAARYQAPLEWGMVFSGEGAYDRRPDDVASMRRRIENETSSHPYHYSRSTVLSEFVSFGGLPESFRNDKYAEEIYQEAIRSLRPSCVEEMKSFIRRVPDLPPEHYRANFLGSHPYLSAGDVASIYEEATRNAS